MIQEPSQKSLSPLIEQIKQKISIIELIGQDVLLRKVGKNYSGLCPFHSERTPSFTVSEEKGLYHCYGCKAGGDLVSYVKETHGMSFMEAVEYLADQAGLLSELKKTGAHRPQEAQFVQKQKTAYKLNRFVSFFYKEKLEQNVNVKNYLSNRGVDAESMKNFYIGFAEEAWDQLGYYLISKKAPLDLGFELGLFQKSKKAPLENALPYFDTFRNRVIFPISDVKGHVVGFGGRLMPSSSNESDSQINMPKYMNSPESFIYKKAEVLFGIFQAKKHIREQNEAIVVEGFFDVIGMHQAGFPQTVATCGTALSLSHLKQLNRFCEKIIILFDGDEAGQNAMIKAMELGLQNNIILYGSYLPKGRDPHDLSLKKEDKILLKSLVLGAEPLLDSFIEKELSRESSTSEEEKSKSLKKILAWLNMYPNPIGKELRVNRISELTGIRVNALFSELKMKTNSFYQNTQQLQIRQIKKAAPQQKIVSQKLLEPWEFTLIKAQIHQRVLDLFWDEVSSYFPKEMTKIDIFLNELPKKLTLGADCIITSDPQNLMDFRCWEAWVLQEIEPQKHVQVLSIIRELLLTTGGVLSESQLRGTFQIGLLKLWARFSQTLKLALKDSESRVDLTAHSRLMKEYLDVQRKMKECINFYVNDQGN